MSHNHALRVLQDKGECPGCDDYHRRLAEAMDPDIPKPPGPSYPPTPPFRQAFG